MQDSRRAQAGVRTDAEVRKSGRKALVGMQPMTRVGRAIENGETQGLMKIASNANCSQLISRR